MDFKVSVVIPMYKAGEFILKNTDALLAQTLQELEVVIVNDCSPDNSMELCRERYGNNERVRLIDQPRNMGPGEARNTGIKAARGEYIAFTDADDGVLPDAYERMYDAAKANDADVLHCTGAIYPLVKDPPADLLEIKEEDLLRLPTDRFDVAQEVRTISSDPMVRFRSYLKESYQWNVWNKLYRRTFLLENDLHFGEMRLAEDQVFCFACLLYAKNYVQMPGEFYIYRIAENSLSRGADRIAMLIKAVSAQIDMVPMVHEIMEKCSVFDRGSIQEAVDFISDNLEMIFIRPSFQEAGEEAIIKDGRLKSLFDEKYGAYADQIFYMFMQQHKNYPPVQDILRLISDVDFLKANRDKFGKPALG